MIIKNNAGARSYPDSNIMKQWVSVITEFSFPYWLMTLLDISDNVAFPAIGKKRDCSVRHQFALLQQLQSLNLQRKEKNLNRKKQCRQATGCIWPWEGWLVGSRKWREKERKEGFWITAVFRLKNCCFEAQRNILLFFPQTMKKRKSTVYHNKG